MWPRGWVEVYVVVLFHDRGTRCGWVVSTTPRPHFTPGKDPVHIVEEVNNLFNPNKYNTSLWDLRLSQWCWLRLTSSRVWRLVGLVAFIFRIVLVEWLGLPWRWTQQHVVCQKILIFRITSFSKIFRKLVTHIQASNCHSFNKLGLLIKYVNS